MLMKRFFCVTLLLAVCCADAEVSEYITDKHGWNLTEEQIDNSWNPGFLFRRCKTNRRGRINVTCQP